MFSALIWGIVGSWRSNMTKDMMKNAKKLLFQKMTNITIFCIYEVIIKKNHTTSLLPIWKNIDCSQKTEKIRSFQVSLALVIGKTRICRSNMTRDMVTSMKKFDRKKCKKLQNLNFFEKSIFWFFHHISGQIWPTGVYYTSIESWKHFI